jgi:hypothetical protein
VKTEAKLAAMGDAGQRAFYANAAASIVTSGNSTTIVHHIGSAIGNSSLNLAREILQQGKGLGKITGLESGIEQKFYAVRGMPETFEAIHEWEEFLAEVRIYHDFALESENRIARGQWGNFLAACLTLNFTDERAFNAALGRMMGRDFRENFN